MNVELETEKLRNENSKLTLEIAQLRERNSLREQMIKCVPAITALVAVVGLTFGVIQHFIASNSARLAAAIEMKREVAQPIWERQIDLYLDAVSATATIATTKDEALREEAEARFWVLYFGPLCVVEDVSIAPQSGNPIERAMVRFGNALQDVEGTQDKLRRLSLELAQEIRAQLTPTFGVDSEPPSDERMNPALF